jgi:hypothetical protein
VWGLYDLKSGKGVYMGSWGGGVHIGSLCIYYGRVKKEGSGMGCGQSRSLEFAILGSGG